MKLNLRFVGFHPPPHPPNTFRVCEPDCDLSTVLCKRKRPEAKQSAVVIHKVWNLRNVCESFAETFNTFPLKGLFLVQLLLPWTYKTWKWKLWSCSGFWCTPSFCVTVRAWHVSKTTTQAEMSYLKGGFIFCTQWMHCVMLYIRAAVCLNGNQLD